jgi:hypothetical protein
MGPILKIWSRSARGPGLSASSRAPLPSPPPAASPSDLAAVTSTQGRMALRRVNGPESFYPVYPLWTICWIAGPANADVRAGESLSTMDGLG